MCLERSGEERAFRVELSDDFGFLIHVFLPLLTVTPLGLRLDSESEAPTRPGHGSGLNWEMLSPLKNAEKPTAPPPHQNPISYDLYGFLISSTPISDDVRVPAVIVGSCSPTPVSTFRDHSAYLSISEWRRLSATRYPRWEGGFASLHATEPPIGT